MRFVPFMVVITKCPPSTHPHLNTNNTVKQKGIFMDCIIISIGLKICWVTVTWMTAWVSSILFKITLPGDQIALEVTAKQWMFPFFCPMNSESEEGARVVGWWEHSPSTNVVRVHIPALMPLIGWVCCWFSPLLWTFFLRLLRFSPLFKNQHF